MKSRRDNRLSRTKRALERNDFEVFIASTRNDVVKMVSAPILADAKVGVGGSVTIREFKSRKWVI